MAVGHWGISIFISLLSVSETAENCDKRVSTHAVSQESAELRVLTPPNSPYAYVLPMVAARSCCSGVIIRYVLPVLWMTSYGGMALPRRRRAAVLCTPRRLYDDSYHAFEVRMTICSLPRVMGCGGYGREADRASDRDGL